MTEKQMHKYMVGKIGFELILLCPKEQDSLQTRGSVICIGECIILHLNIVLKLGSKSSKPRPYTIKEKVKLVPIAQGGL